LNFDEDKTSEHDSDDSDFQPPDDLTLTTKFGALSTSPAPSPSTSQNHGSQNRTSPFRHTPKTPRPRASDISSWSREPTTSDGVEQVSTEIPGFGSTSATSQSTSYKTSPLAPSPSTPVTPTSQSRGVNQRLCPQTGTRGEDGIVIPPATTSARGQHGLQWLSATIMQGVVTYPRQRGS